MTVTLSQLEAKLLELIYDAEPSRQARLEALLGRMVIAIAKAEEPSVRNTEWELPVHLQPRTCNDIKIKYEPNLGIHPPIPNGILIKDAVSFGGPIRQFQVFVRSQDSTEYLGEFEDIDQARKEWAEGTGHFGGAARSNDAPFFEWEDGRYVEVDP